MAAEEKTKQRTKPCAFHQGLNLIDKTAHHEQ